ncbi:MAG: hypothetical protein C4533_04885 [Candidatus Omnitrophota bacterium]|jgi:hypothetical protein|nr:MAG: hypothetical protein C4533_04885 [Candidatus Omnitrophota bacterium]
MPGRIKFTTLFIIFIAALIIVYLIKIHAERMILSQIISRLTAESRIAQVIVTRVEKDPATNKELTTIKFLEYDTDNSALKPRYFTFPGNIIHFQALVIRFDDKFVMKGNRLKGKSAYIFMKTFVINGKEAQVYEINKVDNIPSGYEIKGRASNFQKKIWKEFWDYALDNDKAKLLGIKNAQIEAPASKFVPGILYTVKIEHDGGIRIDTQPLPKVLDGEINTRNK